MINSARKRKSFKSESSSFRIKKMSRTFQINLLPIVNFDVNSKHKYYLQLFVRKKEFIYLPLKFKRIIKKKNSRNFSKSIGGYFLFVLVFTKHFHI